MKKTIFALGISMLFLLSCMMYIGCNSGSSLTDTTWAGNDARIVFSPTYFQIFSAGETRGVETAYSFDGKIVYTYNEKEEKIPAYTLQDNRLVDVNDGTIFFVKQ